MLICAKCGHDNFPITNAQIYGYYANSESLQFVEFCTECGDRIAEECKVCHRLHPLNSTHCALYGIKIEDFLSLKTDLNTRSEVFKNLPEVKMAMSHIARYNFRLLLVAILGVLFCASFSLFDSTLIPIVIIIGLILAMTLTISKAVIEIRYSDRMKTLWKKVNPGVLVPGSIEVDSNSIDISFVEWRDRFHTVSLDNRLIDLILNPAQ